MSEDIGNVEADLEALMAALELAGVMADQARRQAVALAQRMRKDAPRSRAEWDQRAQLVDGQGHDLGGMDTKDTRRIDLNDQTGSKDRNVSTKTSPAEGDTALMEAEGQFFAIQPGQRPEDPERVRPISLEGAQARLAEHRPDLEVRHVDDGEPRLEVTRPTSTATTTAGEASGAGRERPGSGSQWEMPETERSAEGDRPERSAAEAFGAASSRSSRRTAPDEDQGAGPSTAELTAVGATKTAGAGMNR